MLAGVCRVVPVAKCPVTMKNDYGFPQPRTCTAIVKREAVATCSSTAIRLVEEKSIS